MEKKKVAIIGATGLLGQKLLEILCARQQDDLDIFLYASQKSHNKQVQCCNKKFVVQKLTDDIENENFHTAFFMCEGEISLHYVPLLASKGTYCIDNSSYFRLASAVPLIITSVNADKIANKNIIANPNCAVIQIATCLAPLLPFKIDRVDICTFQAASGAGKEGLQDLLLKRKGKELKKFPYQLHDNLIPQIDDFCSDGYTKEEHKIIRECAKILQLSHFSFTATCVRVPISNCHCASISCKFSQKVNCSQIFQALQRAKGVCLYDDVKHKKYPMPIVAKGKTDCFVGRLRQDITDGKSIHLFVAADNLLRGGAYNAYEIATCIWEGNRQNEMF